MNVTIDQPNLTEYQKAFLYNDSRFTITEASTKIGKTFSHKWWLFEQAHLPERKDNDNVWWVAPVYSQTKIAFKRLKAKIGRTGIYNINESNLTITTPKGVVMHFKSADKPDNLFGEDVYAIVFDEAPRAKVEAYYALRSTITATRGKMKMIGNFGGLANWMHQLKEKAKTDKEYSYYKINAWDGVKAGILDEEEVLQAQRDLPPKVFKQLYLAEEQESDDQLIPFNVMQSMYHNDEIDKEETTRYITADIALHGSDKFVILVWNGFRIIDFYINNKISADGVETKLKSLAEKYKVQRGHIVYDADGLGSFLMGYLRGAIPFKNGSRPTMKKNYKNLKNQCGYEFAKRCNNEGIMIDCNLPKEDIFKELECLQSHALDKDGKLQLLPKDKIKEIIGHSPDILDALTMRMYFDVKPKRTFSRVM